MYTWLGSVRMPLRSIFQLGRGAWYVIFIFWSQAPENRQKKYRVVNDFSSKERSKLLKENFKTVGNRLTRISDTRVES